MGTGFVEQGRRERGVTEVMRTVTPSQSSRSTTAEASGGGLRVEQQSVSGERTEKERSVVKSKAPREEEVVRNRVMEKDVVVEEVEERVLEDGAVFPEVVGDAFQEEEIIVEVGVNESVEEVERIPLRTPKEASTVVVFPSVKKDVEVEKGPSCKVCVTSKKRSLGRYSTDVGMAAHSRKHSRQVCFC